MTVYTHSEIEVTIKAEGCHRILEKLGFKTEFQIASEAKRAERMEAFRETLKKRFVCPECQKDMPELARNKHHAMHQAEGRS